MAALAEIQVIGLQRLQAGLDAFAASLEAETEKAMKAAVLLVEAEAKSRVPRKTGRLFSSIQSGVTATAGELIGEIGTGVSYAPFIEEGTRAHDIAPVTAHALMIPVGSSGGFGGGRLSGAPHKGQQVAFFKKVRHPGTSAKPYLKPALEENKAAIQGLFTAAAQRVLGAIKGI